MVVRSSTSTNTDPGPPMLARFADLDGSKSCSYLQQVPLSSVDKRRTSGLASVAVRLSLCQDAIFASAGERRPPTALKSGDPYIGDTRMRKLCSRLRKNEERRQYDYHPIKDFVLLTQIEVYASDAPDINASDAYQVMLVSPALDPSCLGTSHARSRQ